MNDDDLRRRARTLRDLAEPIAPWTGSIGSERSPVYRTRTRENAGFSCAGRSCLTRVVLGSRTAASCGHPLGRRHMQTGRDTWPELVYRFVEYYRWEPDKLGPTTSAFYRKIRSQEVPLNFLFNLLLYSMPVDLRRSAVAIDGCLPGGGPVLKVLNPWHTEFCQPDVHLESEAERVFLELKVNARTNLEQSQKYGLLHASLSRQDATPKRPVLIYVTRRDFSKHWTPQKEAPAMALELGNKLTTAELSTRLAANRNCPCT